ncbi:unnamed protein product [marine sediment metagenome]|uniref:Uncharacterized protein n=1 Tax=marine sediment metagenome TaxID=412755 RepID=X1P572_9ZZZZ
MDKVKVAVATVGASLLMFALAKIVAAKPPPEGEVKVIKVGVKE